MSIDWGSVYNSPVGQILNDLSPTTFAALSTQETTSQESALNTQVSNDKTEINAWTTLQADAQGVASDLATLSNATTYNSLQVSSSSNSVATAVDNNAQQGSYTITAQTLAQAEIDTGSSTNMAVTDPTSTLEVGGSPLQGSFSIQLASQTSPISVTIPTAGVSLNGLASLINKQSGMGVAASVVENGSGEYVLEIQANQTGQAISYTQSPSGSQSYGPLYYLGLMGTGTTASGASQVLQPATEASVSFGSSYNSAEAVTSSTNTFTNLIPGLTITLQSPGTTTLNVSPDVGAMQSSVQQFVSDWNQWVSDTQNLAEAGSVTESGTGKNASYSYSANNNQVLTNGLPQSVLNEVQNTLASTTSSGGGAYQSLGAIGLTFGANGKITVNNTVLSQALSQNPTAVQGIFSALNGLLGGAKGPLDGFDLGPTSSTGEAIATLTQQEGQDNGQITSLKQQSSNEEEQAIIKYGQWVNQVARSSEQYSMLSALFNLNNTNTGSTGG